MNAANSNGMGWKALCLAAVLMAAAISMVPATAHAQRPTAPALTDKQDQLVNVYLKTRRCMRSAGRAAHERSDNPRDVQYFMVSVCSTAMLQFLMEDMSEDEARGYLLNITRTTYYEDVLGIPEPK